MFRLRCILHASKIREKRASRASVDSDRQRRNRQSGTDTRISGIFNGIPVRRNSRDICLSRRRVFLFPFYFFFLPFSLKGHGGTHFIFHSTIFLFYSPPFQLRVPVVWTTARILFRRLRTIFPAGKCSPRFLSRSLLIGIFFSRISMYITVQDKWRFQTLREISLSQPVIYFKFYNILLSIIFKDHKKKKR